MTDGRSVTQRLKLEALGLGGLPVYISEEYGEPKPCPIRFELIADSYPGRNLVYVGDNPKKDFVTPNRMGWTTFGVVNAGRNVHSQELGRLEKKFHPDYWIECVEDLQLFLC